MTAVLLALGLFVFGVVTAVVPVRMALRLRRHVAHERNTPVNTDNNALPPAAIILPIKGLAEELADLESNLRPVLEQNYPSYRVIFAVGDEHDLAVPVLTKLVQSCPHAQLVVAPQRPGCSHKLSNQLRALDELDQSTQVLVFMDCDARPAHNLLRRLVAPLNDQHVGATTGFRWYTPSPHAGLGSWLRAAWNVGGMPMLVDEKYNYAWGGAMAIRRDVFNTCGIADFWLTALSDDLGLSMLVKQAGYRIHFVPQCLVQSPEDLTFSQTVEWTTRQTVVCRVYNPVMWRDLLIGELLTAFVLLLAVGITIAGIVRVDLLLILAGLLTAGLFAAGRMIFQWLIVTTARKLAPTLIDDRDTLMLVLLAPLVHPLILFNSLRSWINRRIRWRGIAYELKGPQNIIIIPDPPAASTAS